MAGNVEVCFHLLGQTCIDLMSLHILNVLEVCSMTVVGLRKSVVSK